MRASLEAKLLSHLDANIGWHKKVSLYVLADQLGYSPETCGRCLRNAAESGKIRVDYYKGTYASRLARYASLLAEPKYVPQVKFITVDGITKAII